MRRFGYVIGMKYAVISLVTGFCMLGVLSCGEQAELPDTSIIDTSQEADVDSRLEQVNCPTACERAARCEKTLTTVEDCTALCQASTIPQDYACCLQFASGCEDVLACIQSEKPTCEPEGDPWLPLRMGDECDCGVSPSFSVECRQESPGHPCPSNTACFKPVNSNDPPTCRVICTGNADKCTELDLGCTKTPKTWYCD